MFALTIGLLSFILGFAAGTALPLWLIDAPNPAHQKADRFTDMGGGS